jgi:putative membrane protein
MGPDYPWWGPMWFFPSIMPIIMLLVVIAAFYLVFGRGGFCSPWHGLDRHYNRDRSPESSLEILKKRYARGEITKEEFELMKQDIIS